MTDHVTIPTSEQLRRTLSEASRIASDIIDSYRSAHSPQPSDSKTNAKLEFLEGLRTDLSFREASLANAFNGAHPTDTAPGHALQLKAYAGSQLIGGTSVVVATATQNLLDNRYLRPRKDLLKSSGRTFAWGNSQKGKGLQLALSILADFAGDDYALANYETFWQSVVRNLPANAWRITGDQILAWTNDHPQTHAEAGPDQEVTDSEHSMADPAPC